NASAFLAIASLSVASPLDCWPTPGPATRPAIKASTTRKDNRRVFMGTILSEETGALVTSQNESRRDQRERPRECGNDGSMLLGNSGTVSPKEDGCNGLSGSQSFSQMAGETAIWYLLEGRLCTSVFPIARKYRNRLHRQRVNVVLLQRFDGVM